MWQYLDTLKYADQILSKIDIVIFIIDYKEQSKQSKNPGGFFYTHCLESTPCWNFDFFGPFRKLACDKRYDSVKSRLKLIWLSLGSVLYDCYQYLAGHQGVCRKR